LILDIPLQQREDFFSFACISNDKAWLDDASSPFSAVKSSTVKEKLGGDTA
jgi:hypothetical protein